MGQQQERKTPTVQNLQNMKVEQQQKPGIIIRDQGGAEHVATFESIIDGLKAANGQLLEENAILKSILKTKGVNL